MSDDTKPIDGNAIIYVFSDTKVVPIGIGHAIRTRRWLREYDRALAEAVRQDRMHPYKPKPQRDPK